MMAFGEKRTFLDPPNQSPSFAVIIAKNITNWGLDLFIKDIFL